MDKLLFTGGTGFLGHNVMPLLKERYEVTTCGITNDDMIKANLAKEIPVLPERYDVVLHAAGKAHMVPRTEAEKQLFFDINYTGTIHLCDALEKVGCPRALVFISTVAVYGCEFGDLITEEHSLEGDKPYAKSLLQAVDTAVELCKDGQHGIPVPDYVDENVSTKVVKIIQSYVGIVNKMVWRK